MSSRLEHLSDDETKQLKILTNFTPEEIQTCYCDFIKESDNGVMDEGKFELFWSKYLSLGIHKQFSYHLFRSFDFNNDGFINFREFICGLSMSMRGSADEKLTWAFNMYDVNKDGTITLDEMFETMRAVYAINGLTEPEQVQNGREAFEGIDEDGDGRITVAEFIKGVKQDKRLIKFLECPFTVEQVGVGGGDKN